MSMWGRNMKRQVRLNVRKLLFPNAFLDEDRIVVKEEDELGLTSLVVYRVSR